VITRLTVPNAVEVSSMWAWLPSAVWPEVVLSNTVTVNRPLRDTVE